MKSPIQQLPPACHTAPLSVSGGIIGGMFGLELRVQDNLTAQATKPAFLTEPSLLLATARSAFTLLHRTLRPPRVWLPSYLCGAVLHAFLAQGAQVRFYAMDDHLQIAEEAWLTEVKPGDLVVFIDYFGFESWAGFAAESKRRGAWVVEDAVQAMLNETFCQYSHFVIMSPRKFVGVPDGGILLARADAKLPKIELAPPPADWWLEAATASVLRAEFDEHGGERTWFHLFQKTEPTGPVEPCRMSELSALLLQHRIDWTKVARRRRENFQFLASALGEIALFRELPDGVVPLGFPIRLKCRDSVRRVLFANEIFPPVHWPLEGVVPPAFAASHHLAAEIMTLPCDQRCGQQDMARIISVVSATQEASK